MHDVQVNPAHVCISTRRSSTQLAFMTKKNERQKAILQLVGAHQVASQEDLKRLLTERGWAVTQATLSRDLRDLGVVRAQTDTGARYLLPAMVAGEDKPSLG